MSYLEELLPEFKKGAKIRRKDWRDGKYIKLSGVYAKDEYGDVYFIEPNEITADDWELYKDPEPDWQYIIDHKYLCWFWRQDVNFKLISVLREITNNLFIDTLGNCWENCRPVRKDEVTFYEDRKDDKQKS